MTWTPMTARTTWVTAKLLPAKVGWTSSKAMPARWSPAPAFSGTFTVKGTGSSVWGATVTVLAAALTQAPAFFTGSCRLPYTAPDVGAVSPSTPDTASSTGVSPVLVTITSSVKVSPGATVGLKYALVDGSLGSAWAGRSAIPKLADAGAAGSETRPAAASTAAPTTRR